MVVGAGVDGKGEPSDPAPDQGLAWRIADAQRDVSLTPAEVQGDIADDEFDLDAGIGFPKPGEVPRQQPEGQHVDGCNPHGSTETQILPGHLTAQACDLLLD